MSASDSQHQQRRQEVEKLPCLPIALLDIATTTTHYYDKQLLRTGAFADCTITCKGRSWRAHRSVLSPRCDFFTCCFDGRFSEGRTRMIAMEDDDPGAVEGMLYYLYTLDYPTEIYEKLLGAEMGVVGSGSDSGIEDEDSAMAPHARLYWRFDLCMFKVADKYALPELRELARRSLLRRAELVAKEHELEKSTGGFVGLVEDLFTTEDMSDQLREVRMQLIYLTCEAVTLHVRDERVLALMADVPEFAIELVEALGKKRDEKRLVQQEDDRKREVMRVHLSHIPMNDESDDED